jgi:hypothetical protein
MAGDSDLSKGAADRGKGKAVDDKKPEEVKKDKDGKPIVNGKKDDDKVIDGLFSFRRQSTNVHLTNVLQVLKSLAKRTSN